jgi:hypothetical protein
MLRSSCCCLASFFLGYRKIVIDGQQYLLNDTTNHLLVVPATGIPQQRVSEKAQSLSPINLAQDSFDKVGVAPSVTLSDVKKGVKRTPILTTNVPLSKNNGSNDKIIYVPHHRKKRKLVPLPALQLSEEVQVVEQVTLDLEVKNQDLPKTGRFGDYANDTNSVGRETVTGSSSDKSVNLLADDSDKV